MASEELKINPSPLLSGKKKLSVITVIRNADKLLQALIDNVKKYKTEEIEFVIVDGASTDQSVEIIKQNLDVVDRWISEPDKGIYDAMNKSTRIASGKWLFFMGADDQLEEGFTAALASLEEENTIYYGGVIFNGQPKLRAYNTYDLTKENVCHQAIFYPKDVFEKYFYHTGYVVFADYYLNVQLWNDQSFLKKHISYIVANYAPGGFSDTIPDPAYRRDRDNWFKWHLGTLDHLRYINRSKGLKGILKSLFSSSNELVTNNPENKTILVIDDYVPYYDKSSGSKRLFELLKLFKELDFKVIFLPDDGKATLPYYRDLLNLGIEVLIHNPHLSNIDQLKKRLGSISYAWISRPALNRKYHKILHKNTRKIFDTVDLHYLRMLRQSENENNPKLKKKALKTKELELNLARSSQATITVTDIEKTILENEGIHDVYVIPNVHETIDSEQIPFNERKGILFIGGYKHEPNVDAVIWLVNDIMPLVWAKIGEIPLYLLGSDPSQEVLQLASELVIVPGYLNDVSSYFLSSRIFVAPLRYGAGMKGKIGQSLEYGLPIVSTSIGIEGMNLTDGKNVLKAENNVSFAEKIISLYQNEELWNTISEESSQSIRNYSPENVKVQLDNLFKSMEEKQ